MARKPDCDLRANLGERMRSFTSIREFMYACLGALVPRPKSRLQLYHFRERSNSQHKQHIPLIPTRTISPLVNSDFQITMARLIHYRKKKKARMATLADELEADFADIESPGEDDFEENGDDAALEATEATDATDGSNPDPSKHRELKAVYELVAQLNPVVAEMDRVNALPADDPYLTVGNLDSNPVYKLVVDSNSLASRIDDEMVVIHKFISDRYSLRFPELDTLIQNRVKYISTVVIIGNGPFDQLEAITKSTDNPVGKTLREVLDGPTVLNVRMEAATTKGSPLDDITVDLVISTCKTALQLDDAKTKLTRFVQSKMPLFAPNLTALIGAEVAAQMVNAAGGIKQLSAVPSVNLGNMGNSRQRYGASNLHERQGFLYFSPIIQDVPIMNRKLAIKRLQNKVSLAARVDLTRTVLDGSLGETYRNDVIAAIERITEAAPNRGVRALPVPDEKPSKKRGGKKARAEKNRNAYTELRQAQNRMVFGQEEQEVTYGDESVGMGMVGSGDAGRIRAIQIDERTKAKLSKKHPGWGGGNTSLGGKTSLGGGAGHATGLRTSGVNAAGAATLLGTMSTLNFSQHQGLSLADPSQLAANEKAAKDAKQDKYFAGGSFTRMNGAGDDALKRKAGMEFEKDKDGFKKPVIPALKRVKKSE